jgi:hypothetical protein
VVALLQAASSTSLSGCFAPMSGGSSRHCRRPRG